jgi:cellulose synthase/poly-beta-1,6-N-acetylglucosamine synthase-like glycosyltransferase
MFNNVLLTVDYIAIVYFVIINVTYIILNFVAFFSIRKNQLKKEVLDIEKTFSSEFYKPLSIIVPAYNEQETISENIKSILKLNYPEFEIIVVNDGSTDNTIEQLKDDFNLKTFNREYTRDIETEEIKNIYKSLSHPNLVVIDKENGGKGDALNAGVNLAGYPLVCNIDGDSLIDSQALLRIVAPFVNDWRVVAAGGTVRIANSCKVENGQVTKVNLSKKHLVRMQVIEYLRAFLFGRVGWAGLNSLLIISGAFGVFKKKHLIKAGGYNTNTVGEDMELVLRLNRKMNKSGRKYKIVFLPEPVCWTQVPEKLKTLGKQRKRWHQGLGESLFYNFQMFFNYNYGTSGLVAFPFYFFIELLGPILEVFGYISIILTFIYGVGGQGVILLFLFSSIMLGILLSLTSLLFEEMTFRKYEKTKDLITLSFTAILENFGYKQINSIWRFIGLYKLITRNEEWGFQERSSFEE